jgi:starch synthase (maltosyl-transferring)
VRHWNWNDPHSLQPLMKRINRIRRENPALQFMRNIRFHPIENPHLIAYSKQHEGNLVLCVVNLDPYNTQTGWLTLPLAELGIPEHRPFEVHDRLGGARYTWHGATNFIGLDPHPLPAHIFVVHYHRESGQEFDIPGRA